MTPRPLVLIILDGWGHRAFHDANAIAAAHTPHWDTLLEKYPHTLLHASGLEVGLPEGQMGNSEVGHLTMGAGRVVFQDLMRISMAIRENEFNSNPVLRSAFQKIVEKNSTLHVLGLLSSGGVHSHEDHIFSIIKAAKDYGLKKLVVHPFLDGRDTPPKSAAPSLKKLEALCHSIEGYAVGSVVGRYYAMDRDNRFERTRVVYELLVEGKAHYCAKTISEALQQAYERGESDEFVSPTLLCLEQENEPKIHAHVSQFETEYPVSLAQNADILIKDDDSILFMNFRSDRARQLSRAFTDPNFDGFQRKQVPKISQFITLTEYAKTIQADVIFPPQALPNGLGEFLERHHLTQCRIAETEKYAHVTFFFNGGRDEPYTGEDRILIPSLKIPTYDLTPEMSAFEITEALCQSIANKKYDVIICNFANADMVGHTGNFAATVEAIEVLDTCIGKIVDTLEAVGGEALITSDHGNAELMFDAAHHQPHTAHTNELVPLIYIGHRGTLYRSGQSPGGGLADIAPTLITLLGFPLPSEMTGRCLVNFL